MVFLIDSDCARDDGVCTVFVPGEYWRFPALRLDISGCEVQDIVIDTTSTPIVPGNIRVKEQPWRQRV